MGMDGCAGQQEGALVMVGCCRPSQDNGLDQGPGACWRERAQQVYCAYKDAGLCVTGSEMGHARAEKGAGVCTVICLCARVRANKEATTAYLPR